MKYFLTRRYINLLAVVGSVLLLSACAATIDTQSQLEERATARWDTLLSGDLAGAYQYLSPGYRSSVSSLQYQRSILLKKVKWTSAEYIEHKCGEAACKVRILLGFTVYGALPGVKSFEDTQEITESWVLSKGEWYLVPE